MRRDMVGRNRRHRHGGEGEVHEGGIGILSIGFEGGDIGVRVVRQGMFPRIDHAHEPSFAYRRLSLRSGLQVGDGCGEEEGDGFLRRRRGEGFGDGFAPELQAHEADGVGGGSVGDHGERDVQSTESEVHCLSGARDEGIEGVGGAIIFAGVLLARMERECNAGATGRTLVGQCSTYEPLGFLLRLLLRPALRVVMIG